MTSIFEDEVSNSRRLTRKDYDLLRGEFDGDEENVFHGMSIVAPRSEMTHERPERDDPQAQFLYNDRGTREFLLKTFPLLQINKAQRLQARTWAVVVYYYFRLGWPDSRIEREFHLGQGSVGFAVQQIRRKIKGLRRNGKPYSTRKPGRPRKITVMPAPAQVSKTKRQAA